MEKSRSSPRASDYLHEEVTQHQYWGLRGKIMCMTIDPSDNTMLLFTNSALYAVSSSGTTSVVSGDETVIGFADGGRGEARYNSPCGMTLDQEKKLMYVVDTGNHAFRIIQLWSGDVYTVAGRGEESGFLDGVGDAARFSRPVDIVLGSNDSIYICDKQNHSLRRIALGGHEPNQHGPYMGNPLPAVVSTVCGGTMYGARALSYVDDPLLPALDIATLYGARDGPSNVALFNHPIGIAQDKNGQIIVADYTNSMIRSVDPTSGMTSTLVGVNSKLSWEQHGRWHCNGPRETAIINHPTSLCIDKFNNIIFADCHNNQIRILRTCGTMFTLAGGGAQNANGFPPQDQDPVNGRGASVRFNKPQQVMLDHNGFLHVLETGAFWTRRLKYTAIST